MLSVGCQRDDGSRELNHRFPDQVWGRFNMLSFELPIVNPGSYDVLLVAVLTTDYPHATLDFNMTMNTPTGEDRINEYSAEVRDARGDLLHGAGGDSVVVRVVLKKGINLGRKGMLKIRIENLIPKIQTPGVRQIGIRLEPVSR